MKFLITLTIACISAFAVEAANQNTNQPTQPAKNPTTIGTNFKSVFMPKGFDSNDNVQIAAEGVFMNSCLKVAPPLVKVDETTKTITLEAQAYQYGGMCMQMQTPFQQIIDLGIIRTPGQYKIVNAKGEAIGQIEVAKARTTDPDDYFYAPVQQVIFKDGAKNKVSLRVEFNHSCLSVSEVKVDKQENVIVLQPIAKISQRFGCAIGYYPHVVDVDLGDVENGRYLLHVRSSGSQAINQIFTIE